mmetsp:Transcript_41527/g.115481  ORF Transcript_41527/g.115481 Transcript_41527/m.115481 type:complete len:238 (+) Transcript_41527:614-1327(+)
MCKAQQACSCTASEAGCASMAFSTASTPLRAATFILLLWWLAARLCMAARPCSCTPSSLGCACIAFTAAPTAPAPVSSACCSGRSASSCRSLQPCSCTAATAWCMPMASRAALGPSAVTTGSQPPARTTAARVPQPCSCTMLSGKFRTMFWTTSCAVRFGICFSSSSRWAFRRSSCSFAIVSGSGGGVSFSFSIAMDALSTLIVTASVMALLAAELAQPMASAAGRARGAAGRLASG